MISAFAWVRKGVAKEIPDTYELNEEEYQRINELAGDRFRMDNIDEDGDTDMITDEKPSKKKNKSDSKEKVEIDPELAIYKLEDYDDSSEEDVQDDEGTSKNKGEHRYMT
jgi:periodic tryptophan protein 1